MRVRSCTRAHGSLTLHGTRAPESLELLPEEPKNSVRVMNAVKSRAMFFVEAA